MGRSIGGGVANSGVADYHLEPRFQRYHERQVEQNILQGQAYFNGPSPPKPPEQHAPNELRQCHRKTWYKRLNAPKETIPPQGLFFFGTRFEEDVIVPYLQDRVTTETTYVQNSIWIDATLTVNDTTLRIKGATDPTIVTIDGEPLYLTEIKTTTSLDHLTESKEHHRAQLHAYLFALNKEYNHSITNGLLLYGSRTSLNIKVFHVSFNEEFWAAVTDWMATQTRYQRLGNLPPATPERDWECKYCPFKNRCGQADTPYTDIEFEGLLPLFNDYDRQTLTEYLEYYRERNAKLTPTLAHSYPDLVDEYGAFDWSCASCNETYAWDAVEWDASITDPPVCQNCLGSGDLVTLSGPEPDVQLTQ